MKKHNHESTLKKKWTSAYEIKFSLSNLWIYFQHIHPLFSYILHYLSAIEKTTFTQDECAFDSFMLASLYASEFVCVCLLTWSLENVHNIIRLMLSENLKDL